MKKSMWILFLLLWLAFFWTLDWQPKTENVQNIQISLPTLRRNCNGPPVACIDDCSFLCVEPEAQCVGGLCELAPVPPPCLHGLLTWVEEPPHWTCLCTDPHFYGGPECSILLDDVCERGIFVYRNRDNHDCFCLPPYKRFTLHHKPYCLEEHLAEFFRESR